MSFRKDGLPLQHGASTLLAESRLEQPQQEELFVDVLFASFHFLGYRFLSRLALERKFEKTRIRIEESS